MQKFYSSRQGHAVIVFWLMAGCTYKTITPAVCSDLGWLSAIENSIVQSGHQGEINSYRYKNATVFEINGCLDCVDYITTVNNCSGQVICQFGGFAGLNTCPDFHDLAKEKKLVWKN